MSNTELWDALGKTDPAHTKSFSRAGGFKGTALKPMWAIKRLTEQFGPYGVGWGSGKPEFQLVHGQEDEVLVYCTVEVWHTSRENVGYGVGGDKPIARNKNGLFYDDEAFKKSHTDAMMNGFKNLGIGADIHMGQFDDSKYVQEMEKEFAPKVATITDAQREELMLLCDRLNVPVDRFLSVGGVKDLREVPASQFGQAKQWIEAEGKKLENNNA